MRAFRVRLLPVSASLSALALVLTTGACTYLPYRSLGGEDDGGPPDATMGVCGDGMSTGSEDCDGADLEGESCASLGLGVGALGCSPGCSYDLSGCASCGNGVIEGIEECDGTALGGASCVTQGFTDGVLGCSGCVFDTASCTSCGDGVADAGEDCDGADLSGESCSSLGAGSGTLICTASCTYNLSGCASCGNGAIDMGEDCDGADLAGETCTTLGFAGGALTCVGCIFDTAGCMSCGNGVVDGPEQCDGSDLGGASCMSLGFPGGVLVCAPGCTYDNGGCFICGNAVADPGESCDGVDLGGASCMSLGLGVGMLACSAGCTHDTSGCTACGNGTVDGGEDCDGADLGGATCSSLGLGGGMLACAPGCIYDTGGCGVATCGDGVVDPGEQCDPPGGACDGGCQVSASACPAGVGAVLCGDVIMGNSGMGGSASLNTTYGTCAGTNGGSEVAYAFVSNTAQDVYFEITGTSSLDPFLLTGAPACDPTTCFDSNGTNIPGVPDGVFVSANAGDSYYFLIDALTGVTSPYTLRVLCSPPVAGAGSCANPYVVSLNGPTTLAYAFDTCTSGNALDPPNVGDCTSATGGDVVYRIDATVSTTVTIDVIDMDNPAAIDTVAYLQTTCGGGAPETLACNDDYLGEPRHSQIVVSLAAGTSYYLVADSTASFGCGRTIVIIDAP